MIADKHTPGPWHVDGWRGIVIGEGEFKGTHFAVWASDNDTMICPTGLDCESEANARRIVACVNACAGIDTNYLEAPDNLATHARKMMVQRHELLAALKEAKCLIQAWHGDVAWEIYDQHSPEMKRINSAIAKAEAKS